MESRLDQILKDYKEGLLSLEEAVHQIENGQSIDMGFANIDLQRKRRRGTSEVIYGASKTPDQIIMIARKLIEHGQTPVLITRLSADAAAVISQNLDLQYDKMARIGIIGEMPKPNGIGKIAVVTAGTSDMPVAEEAVKTLEFLGNEVERFYDVGVAGIHRLLAKLDKIRSASQSPEWKVRLRALWQD